ncbi:hypothetical protein BASA81_006570 [Batrachochytrium salamandrivorans]|nr:hypothetical protein BASA81_006570 [Batrachochytrium salamandrivorans]
MIPTTRAYHDAFKQWRAELPKFDADSEALFPLSAVPPTYSIFDVDHQLLGKSAVFFNIGVVMYQLRRRVDVPGSIIGHVKCLVPHHGALMGFFDDIQGIGLGEVCLTKSMELIVDVDRIPFDETLQFGMKYSKRDLANGRVELTTQCELYTLAVPPVRVAHSKALFIQTPEIIKFGQHSNLSDPKVLAQVWDNLAELRIKGDHYRDAGMDFKLVAPPSPILPSVPEWWDVTGMENVELENQEFPGRFYFFHAQRSRTVCRAVMQPTRTAEGANTLLHGGAAGSAALKVLGLIYPDLNQLEAMLVLFKRPISLSLAQVTIEWAFVEEEEGWVGVILDSEQNIMQQYKALLVPYDEEEASRL